MRGVFLFLVIIYDPYKFLMDDFDIVFIPRR